MPKLRIFARSSLVPFAAFLGITLSGWAAAAQTPAPVVRTADGPVQGIQANGVSEYLGIPYAAPPVGDLRWRPPAPPRPWTQPRPAVKFANHCPQAPRGVFASSSNTEDCLYLNVFTAKSNASGKSRPVMVWFHGGGIYSGESDDYDGSKLASRGGVVLVSLNYRIGPLGFFSHPAIDGEGHTAVNYGLMDQQAALKWVKGNIARFGGDPDLVTIFGQSGGATSVLSQLLSPTAKGLFQRAIIESGIHLDTFPKDVERKLSADFATNAGCADQSAACLRGLSVDQVLKNGGPLVAFNGWGTPMIDGTVITMTPTQASLSGKFNHVPIMNGLVHDEQAYFLAEPNSGVPMTADDYAKFQADPGKGLGTKFQPGGAEKLNAHYPLASYASPSLAEIDYGDGFKACTIRMLNREWARYVPVYGYRFDDQDAPSYFPAVSYKMGAYHTAELQYLFPLFHGGRGTAHPLSPMQEKLSDQMVDYWTNFATTGRPDAGPHKVPAWPRYVAKRDNVQSLAMPASKPIENYGREYDCTLWESAFAYK